MIKIKIFTKANMQCFISFSFLAPFSSFVMSPKWQSAYLAHWLLIRLPFLSVSGWPCQYPEEE
jgi:hypothetical protein